MPEPPAGRPQAAHPPTAVGGWTTAPQWPAMPAHWPGPVRYLVAGLLGGALVTGWSRPGGPLAAATVMALLGALVVTVRADHRPLAGRTRTGRAGAPGTPRAERGRHGTARAAIARVIARDRLRMACQPIVDLTDGSIVGAEALARFLDQPEVSPERRFALAHEVGAGVELELHAVAVALRWLPHLPPDAYLAVNVSPQVLAHPALADLLERCDAPMDRVVVELTEHESVGDYRPLRRSLADLRRRGVRLAIDDTGSGFATFSHVLSLEADVVKLDRSLIRDIDRDAARRALAAAMVLYGLETGARVVAEGVQTLAELELLRTLGIDAAQGFFLGKPTIDPTTWRQAAQRAAACCRPPDAPVIDPAPPGDRPAAAAGPSGAGGVGVPPQRDPAVLRRDGGLQPGHLGLGLGG